MPKESPYDFIFDRNSNSNVCHISHHFQDIHTENMHFLDFDVYNRPRSNVNARIENPYLTSHLMAIFYFKLFFFVTSTYDIHAIKQYTF